MIMVYVVAHILTSWVSVGASVGAIVALHDPDCILDLPWRRQVNQEEIA